MPFFYDSTYYSSHFRHVVTCELYDIIILSLLHSLIVPLHSSPVIHYDYFSHCPSAGPKDQAVSYFKSIGYEVPLFVDVADFLQELPTEEGKRFINQEFRRSTSANNLEDRYYTLNHHNARCLD